jgi:hypothetical protein
MGENTVISTVRELMAGVDQERIWIITIGIMGLVFSAVFATITFFLDILRPTGLAGTQTFMSIVYVSETVFAACSIISVAAAIRVLSFIRNWHKRYLNLQAGQKELEKKYFPNRKTL